MQLDKWIDVEKNSPPNCAVIFGGESLSRLTNNYFLPGFHEVVSKLMPQNDNKLTFHNSHTLKGKDSQLPCRAWHNLG
jgi:isopenicillin N synthase-like dioxygenase